LDLFLVVFVGFSFALAKIGKVNETTKPEIVLWMRFFDASSAKKTSFSCFYPSKALLLLAIIIHDTKTKRYEEDSSLTFFGFFNALQLCPK
jgi:hypothetical protein